LIAQSLFWRKKGSKEFGGKYSKIPKCSCLRGMGEPPLSKVAILRKKRGERGSVGKKDGLKGKTPDHVVIKNYDCGKGKAKGLGTLWQKRLPDDTANEGDVLVGSAVQKREREKGLEKKNLYGGRTTAGKKKGNRFNLATKPSACIADERQRGGRGDFAKAEKKKISAKFAAEERFFGRSEYASGRGVTTGKGTKHCGF